MEICELTIKFHSPIFRQNGDANAATNALSSDTESTQGVELVAFSAPLPQYEDVSIVNSQVCTCGWVRCSITMRSGNV